MKARAAKPEEKRLPMNCGCHLQRHQRVANDGVGECPVRQIRAIAGLHRDQAIAVRRIVADAVSSMICGDSTDSDFTIV